MSRPCSASFDIPTFTAVLKPALEGLNTAFNTVKTAINDNSEELKPLVGFMKDVADFAKDTLAPILGGALKIALNVVAGIVAGLVTGFANLVTGVGKVVSAVKAFIKSVRELGDDYAKCKIYIVLEDQENFPGNSLIGENVILVPLKMDSTFRDYPLAIKAFAAAQIEEQVKEDT